MSIRLDLFSAIAVKGATLITWVGVITCIYISYWWVCHGWACHTAMRDVRTSRNLFTSDFLISITRGREGGSIE